MHSPQTQLLAGSEEQMGLPGDPSRKVISHMTRLEFVEKWYLDPFDLRVQVSEAALHPLQAYIPVDPACES